MSKFSLTYTGIIVIVLAKLAELLGLTIGQPQIETTVLVVAEFVGAIIAFYGRYRKGDVKVFGVRK